MRFWSMKGLKEPTPNFTIWQDKWMIFKNSLRIYFKCQIIGIHKLWTLSIYHMFCKGKMIVQEVIMPKIHSGLLELDILQQ